MAVIHITSQSDLFQCVVAALYEVNQVTKSGIFTIAELFKLHDTLHDCVRDESCVTIYRV